MLRPAPRSRDPEGRAHRAPGVREQFQLVLEATSCRESAAVPRAMTPPTLLPESMGLSVGDEFARLL